MTLLLAVLAIAYLGSMLVQGRALRGVGLPSGTEWVLAGLVLGPDVLAVVDRPLLSSFEPVAAVALGWLPLVIGARFGRPVHERPPWPALAYGVAFSGFTAAFVATAAYVTMRTTMNLAEHEQRLIAIGAGLASCELTRHAVIWVVERYGARGSLSSFITGVAEGSTIVPLLGSALPFALMAPRTELSLPVWSLGLAPLGLGLLLAVMCGTLLWLEAAGPRSWGVLLGAALLGIGIAFRFGLSALAAMLTLSLTLALFSKKRHELEAMLGRTEHSVRLPILLLGGAHLDFYVDRAFAYVIAAAIAARLLSALLCALPIRRAAGAGGLEAHTLGRALLPSGAVTMTIGLAFAQRFPGNTGSVVLLIAAAQTVLGELLGPMSLRRALERAGELPESATAPDSDAQAVETAAATASTSAAPKTEGA